MTSSGLSVFVVVVIISCLHISRAREPFYGNEVYGWPSDYKYMNHYLNNRYPERINRRNDDTDNNDVRDIDFSETMVTHQGPYDTDNKTEGVDKKSWYDKQQGHKTLNKRNRTGHIGDGPSATVKADDTWRVLYSRFVIIVPENLEQDTL